MNFHRFFVDFWAPCALLPKKGGSTICWWIFIAFSTLALSPTGAVAQPPTTAKSVRELEAKFNELVRLNEAFLPTLEQMVRRLSQLEDDVRLVKEKLPLSGHATELAQLSARLDQLQNLRSEVTQLAKQQRTLTAGTPGSKPPPVVGSQPTAVERRLGEIELRLRNLERSGGARLTSSRNDRGTTAAGTRDLTVPERRSPEPVFRPSPTRNGMWGSNIRECPPFRICPCCGEPIPTAPLFRTARDAYGEDTYMIDEIEIIGMECRW